jgi:hypothetical protein
MPLPNLFPRLGDQIQPPSRRPCGGGWICIQSNGRLLGDNTIVLAGRLQRCDGLTNSAQALHLVAVASL